MLSKHVNSQPFHGCTSEIIDLSSSYYFSRLDSIYKYNFKNVNDVPKINKIKVQLYSKDFIKASTLITKEAAEQTLFKIYLTLFVLTQTNLEVKFLKEVKFQGDTEETTSENYILEANLTSKEQIVSFLEAIDRESMYVLHSLSLRQLLAVKTHNGNLSLNINLASLDQIDDLATSHFEDVNLELVNLRVTLMYDSIPSYSTLHNLNKKRIVKWQAMKAFRKELLGKVEIEIDDPIINSKQTLPNTKDVKDSIKKNKKNIDSSNLVLSMEKVFGKHEKINVLFGEEKTVLTKKEFRNFLLLLTLYSINFLDKNQSKNILKRFWGSKFNKSNRI